MGLRSTAAIGFEIRVPANLQYVQISPVVFLKTTIYRMNVELWQRGLLSQLSYY